MAENRVPASGAGGTRASGSAPVPCDKQGAHAPRSPGRPVGRLLFAAWVALAVVPAAARGQARQTAESYGDIKVAVEPEPQGEATHGYFEYAFTITNASEQPHKVTLTLPANRHYAYGNYIRALSRSVEVAGRGSARLSLYLPFHP